MPDPLRGGDAARRVPPHAAHVRAALAFLSSGAWPWEQLLTHQVALEGVPALFADPPEGYLKAIVRP